ncbi:MAG: hypothetical protein JWN65_3146 [Solirubrobacterales bacterium]|nr:hypothetical protein [Solirubrobacterales bacterium]
MTSRTIRVSPATSRGASIRQTASIARWVAVGAISRPYARVCSGGSCDSFAAACTSSGKSDIS